MINLYLFFHLNIMFSSIEEEQRETVIKKCYYPILQLAKENDVKIGIEATGLTLEIINKINSGWVKELRNLIAIGKIYFIGSGYSQIISPLVPWQVTKKNLILGDLVYKEILMLKPKIALINEQAYSSGLIRIYSEQNYEAIIMEWNNCYDANKDWNSLLQYSPQYATDTRKKNKIKIIWNNSILFQKFQRYVHGENSLEDHLDYLYSHFNSENRSLPLYGNDAEVFDFRPGRFNTEAKLMNENEWSRIDKLVKAISKNNNFKWISLEELCKKDIKNNSLILEDLDQIIPVKKQRKYNINRWAITGRDDFKINAKCYKIFDNMIKKYGVTLNDDWKELCYLWSSDFRTHITEKRWSEFIKRLNNFEKKFKNEDEIINNENLKLFKEYKSIYKFDKHFIVIKNKNLIIKFNLKKGLVIEEYLNSKISKLPIFGTLKHGYFENISWLADWYSGHFTFSSPGEHKVTDLVEVKPVINENEDIFSIKANIPTLNGDIIKSWELNKKDNNLFLIYKFNWKKSNLGSLRLHPITFFPKIFSDDYFKVKCANGGIIKEEFLLSQKDVDHGNNVSLMVSSNQGLSLTDGEVIFSDKEKQLKVGFQPKISPFMGMVTNKKVDNKFFTRLSLSAQEIDDTAKKKVIDLQCKIKITVEEI